MAWTLAPRTLRLRMANRALTWSVDSSRCPTWLRARIGRVAGVVPLGLRDLRQRIRAYARGR